MLASTSLDSHVSISIKDYEIKNHNSEPLDQILKAFFPMRDTNYISVLSVSIHKNSICPMSKVKKNMASLPKNVPKAESRT